MKKTFFCIFGLIVFISGFSVFGQSVTCQNTATEICNLSPRVYTPDVPIVRTGAGDFQRTNHRLVPGNETSAVGYLYSQQIPSSVPVIEITRITQPTSHVYPQYRYFYKKSTFSMPAGWKETRVLGYADPATASIEQREYLHAPYGGLYFYYSPTWSPDLNWVRQTNFIKLYPKNTQFVSPNETTCNCQPACGEGKYYSVLDNTCKPARELTINPVCNKNSVCEPAESCNCTDCTNGGADDVDSCGMSNGVQMMCTRDVNFRFPTTSSTQTFTGINAIPTFLSATKSTTFSYESLMNPGQTVRRIAGPTFSFGSNAPTIKGYDVSSTYGNDRINLSRRWLSVPSSINKFPSNSYYLSNVSLSFNSEKFDILFDRDVNAFGIEMYEPMGDNTISGCNAVCVESTFRFELYKNGTLVDNTITFSPENNVDTFFGFSSPRSFDEVRVREITGTNDNEFFGRIYYQDRSAGAQQCETRKVLMTSTANYPDNKSLIFYDYTPQEVTYNGKTIYIYNPIGNTTATLSSIIANPSLEFSKIKKFTTPFQFRPERLTPTNSTTIFTNAGVTRVNSNLLCFFQANGVEKCQYNDAAVGYPVFAQVPSTGQPSDVIYATTRDDTGFVTYARADEVRAFDVQICQPADADICGIGACCPSGKTWDCDTNSCIEKVEENLCVAGPTLKYGRDITEVKNASNQAFALNASCENKQISLSPCSLTPGVVSQGTSPAGYKLYLWPKSASGLSKDYNLVEIESQCWFADNLQESPSQWSSPVNTWDNFSPHNGYGLYDYAYTGVSRPEGYLYQFDAGTNNPAHAGAPAERLQGVCPAGWHVATDCEFQYVEHVLGMSVSDQQNLGSRSSGNVGTRMKADGTSGLDMTLSGTRRWNTDFINGGSEGHFWTSECPATGCYKRILNNTTGTVTRIQGGGEPFDSAHHAAGSIRCVKDGSEIVNSCSEAVCPQGKYWCHSESTCKDAGQTCSTITCNNNGTCDANESCNCNDCTAEADHCGQANGQQMYCSRDKDTTPPIPPAPTGDNCRTVEETNTYTFDVNARSNDTSRQQTLATLEPGEYEITGSGQFIKCTTSNCGWSTGQIYVSGTGPSIYNLREESNTTRNWNVSKNFSLSLSEKLIVKGVQAQMRGSLTVKSRKRVCDNAIECRGDKKTTTVRYIPNASPVTQGWSYKNGIGTPVTDNGVPVWQVNDGGTSNGNAAIIYKKLTPAETDVFLTKGGTLSASIKNLTGASSINGSTAGLLASYLEFAIGKDKTVGGLTLTAPRRYTFVFGLDSTQTPTVRALTTNDYWLAQPNVDYQYKVVGGANAYNLYEAVYDPVTGTVDLFVNGVEAISNYSGNDIASGQPAGAGQVVAYFGSGSSAGTARTNYGTIEIQVKDDACKSNILSQIGACCPADTEWSSVANACVSDSCGEGQYYCHEELKCKPANEPCYALACDDKKVFTYTGSVQDYTVPSDVRKIEVKAWGAGGGGTTYTSTLGGVGAYAFTSLPVNAGEVYKVVVGQGGQGSATVGTFGGGGAGGLAGVSGGSGGGLSGIFKTSFTQPNTLLIAAGGGGASGSCAADCPGGNGGGPNGADGLSVGRADNFFYPGSGGKGGTLTLGGLGGVVPETARNGSNGSALQGGIGGSHNAPSYGGGGGGGGGYFGGGGGSGDATAVAYSTNYTNDASGGGGSSSCPTVNASGDCVVLSGTGSTVPRNTDPDYKTGVGIGGMYTVGGGNGHVVISECRPKPSVTCNNNNICDENESCNCADCNEQVDHCGVSTSGEQLICTKDTAEKCYTDKFPYCLSACLDGYTRNASGQCEPNTTPPTTTGTPFTCQNRAQNTFETIEAKLAPYLSQPGNLNIAANEFGTAQVELEMTQDTRQDNASSFTKEESWARVRELLSLPSSVQVLWTQSSALYSHSAYGGSNRYVHSYVIRETNGSPRQITYATEYLPGYGWRKVYLINKVYPLVDQNGQCLGNNVINTNEDWIAYTTPYYIYLAKLPIIPNTAAGRTFYIYNPEKVISRASMTKEAFLADPITAIQNAPLVPVGNTPLISRHIFNLAQLQSENTTIQNTTIDNLDAFIENRYLCTQNQIGATSCHVNNNGVHAPGTGYNLGSDIYAPITDSDSNIGYIKAETLGTFTINDSTIFQTFSYPVKNAGYVKNDTASATKFCTERGFTSATIASSDSSGAQKMGWNGTAWIADNTGGSYIKSLTCSQGTPQNLTCQTYAGNVQVSGGYLSIQPQSTTQFCREKGFQEPHMVSQYTQDGSCRLWNGTSWFEDEACVAVSEIKCCNSGSTSSSTTSSSSTPTSEIQLGACCPPGSAWNSIANACIPSTCGEGKFYCAAQKKCLAGGQTCDTAVCNNDGVCSGDESCQCGDCTNGGADDKDKCSIIGGIQALCSDDDRGDNKPGACCIPPKRWDSKANSGVGACVECTNTQAPSELQENFDQPYITCHGNGDNAKTHYRYKLTKIGSSETPYISPITPIKEPLLHTTMTKGEYSVECFYGTATTVDTGAAVSPDVCVKNISVKDSGTGAVQGCSRIYGYKGSTLSDEMNTDSDTLYASFRCGSRLPSTGVDRPYQLRVGTNLAELTYDGSMADFFNNLAIGPVSTQTNAYKFETGSTNVSCSVKVGGGYSTNKSCQLRTCVGGECARPNTFSVVHSANAICTTKQEDEYNIGCNPDAPDTNRDACVKWFRDSFDINAGRDTFDIPFTINGRVRNISCKIIPAGSLPAALNVQDNYACTTLLPNGETVQLFNGDQSLQTTAYTVNFDDEKPRILAPKYFTDNTLTTVVEDVTRWQKLPVTAEVTCVDTPTTESTSCACARTLDAGSTTVNALWSQGTADGTLGADIMRYTRTFTTTIPAQNIRVKDTANNASDPAEISPISIDTQAPVVGIQETGTGTTKTLDITLADGISKVWNTTANPNDGTNIQGFIYKKVSKSQAETALFDPTCGVTGVYATVSQSASMSPTRTLSITGVNLANEVISYCTQDNAGNVTRGVYPAEPTGCFSASNMSTVPTLSTYKTPLQANITANKFGYSLSEDAANATCFRGILSSNITTLITNQYTPRATTTLSWSQPATLKNNVALVNTNGYYYHSFTTSNNTNHTNNTVSLPNTSPTGTGPRVVLVDGGNIQINQNIEYSGSDKTLVLIARRTNNSGGNIFIHPNVTRIDAILIADGAVMNAETSNSSTTTSTTTIRNWIDHANILTNRLTINGRIYSFNTRGGSLDTSLAPLTANGRYFDLGQFKSDATPKRAAEMDLERFRIISHDGSATCSLAVNYRVLTTFSLPPVLQRPAGYVGGTCNF